MCCERTQGRWVVAVFAVCWFVAACGGAELSGAAVPSVSGAVVSSVPVSVDDGEASAGTVRGEEGPLSPVPDVTVPVRGGVGGGGDDVTLFTAPGVSVPVSRTTAADEDQSVLTSAVPAVDDGVSSRLVNWRRRIPSAPFSGIARFHRDDVLESWLWSDKSLHRFGVQFFDTTTAELTEVTVRTREPFDGDTDYCGIALALTSEGLETVFYDSWWQDEESGIYYYMKADALWGEPLLVYATSDFLEEVYDEVYDKAFPTSLRYSDRLIEVVELDSDVEWGFSLRYGDLYREYDVYDKPEIIEEEDLYHLRPEWGTELGGTDGEYLLLNVSWRHGCLSREHVFVIALRDGTVQSCVKSEDTFESHYGMTTTADPDDGDVWLDEIKFPPDHSLSLDDCEFFDGDFAALFSADS